MAPAAATVLVLTGPTGSGKSDLALALAQRLGRQLPLEIISADSAQVYRGMDIGTAKPTAVARAQVPHHLIDIRDPAESYSAGEFVRDALASIAAVHARGRTPLIVGGTMLYLRVLRDGLARLPAASAPLRAQLDSSAARVGWPALHAELARVDAVAAARIDRNDAQRIQRALEVYRLTGIPISQWQRDARSAAQPFRWLRLALLPPSRRELREHLELRFRNMMRAGLLEEVAVLHRRGDLTDRHPAMRAVGYRQLWGYCTGASSLEEATQRAVTATAQLAKRQLTWLRNESDMQRFEAHSVGLMEAASQTILAALHA